MLVVLLVVTDDCSRCRGAWPTAWGSRTPSRIARISFMPCEPSEVADDLVQLHVHEHRRAEHAIDRYVWFDAAADFVAPLAHDPRIVLARRAARIHAAFKVVDNRR